MDLFDRYDQLTRTIDQMNHEAVLAADVPYIRLHDYVHYCDVKAFLFAYIRPLRLSPETVKDILAFCCRDLMEIKSRHGECDLYALTYHYFKSLVYRTGNLDTPDDCVEKLDMDRFAPYRAAREKAWHGDPLTAPEEDCLRRVEQEAVSSIRFRQEMQE